jgi:hypothetical protein
MSAEKKLMATFVDKPIQFIFISEDDNINAWKTASIQEGLDSYKHSFLMPDFENSTFRKTFKVTTIPRYIIIGKDSKVIDADAPRPSDPALTSLLNKLTQE